jgi:hypothetical protein
MGRLVESPRCDTGQLGGEKLRRQGDGEFGGDEAATGERVGGEICDSWFEARCGAGPIDQPIGCGREPAARSYGLHGPREAIVIISSLDGLNGSRCQPP